jgi:hypothetical protein
LRQCLKALTKRYCPGFPKNLNVNAQPRKGASDFEALRGIAKAMP